jgi:hypothetical protein
VPQVYNDKVIKFEWNPDANKYPFERNAVGTHAGVTLTTCPETPTDLNTIYVNATTGDDAYAGTAAAPKETIDAAITACDADKIYVVISDSTDYVGEITSVNYYFTGLYKLAGQTPRVSLRTLDYTPSNSNTIYVSKVGDDSTGTGTLASPVLTIAKAITLCSGTIPNVMINDSGTYNECITGTANFKNLYANLFCAPTVNSGDTTTVYSPRNIEADTRDVNTSIGATYAASNDCHISNIQTNVSGDYFAFAYLTSGWALQLNKRYKSTLSSRSSVSLPIYWGSQMPGYTALTSVSFNPLTYIYFISGKYIIVGQHLSYVTAGVPEFVTSSMYSAYNSDDTYNAYNYHGLYVSSGTPNNYTFVSIFQHDCAIIENVCIFAIRNQAGSSSAYTIMVVDENGTILGSVATTLISDNDIIKWKYNSDNTATGYIYRNAGYKKYVTVSLTDYSIVASGDTVVDARRVISNSMDNGDKIYSAYTDNAITGALTYDKSQGFAGHSLVYENGYFYGWRSDGSYNHSVVKYHTITSPFKNIEKIHGVKLVNNTELEEYTLTGAATTLKYTEIEAQPPSSPVFAKTVSATTLSMSNSIITDARSCNATSNAMVVQNSQFVRMSGTGLEITGAAANNGDITINHCDFLDCGKGIDLISNSGDEIIKNCIIHGGGGFGVDVDTTLAINNSVITQGVNVATYGTSCIQSNPSYIDEGAVNPDNTDLNLRLKLLGYRSNSPAYQLGDDTLNAGSLNTSVIGSETTWSTGTIAKPESMSIRRDPAGAINIQLADGSYDSKQSGRSEVIELKWKGLTNEDHDVLDEIIDGTVSTVRVYFEPITNPNTYYVYTILRNSLNSGNSDPILDEVGKEDVVITLARKYTR